MEMWSTTLESTVKTATRAGVPRAWGGTWLSRPGGQILLMVLLWKLHATKILEGIENLQARTSKGASVGQTDTEGVRGLVPPTFRWVSRHCFSMPEHLSHDQCLLACFLSVPPPFSHSPRLEPGAPAGVRPVCLLQHISFSVSARFSILFSWLCLGPLSLPFLLGTHQGQTQKTLNKMYFSNKQASCISWDPKEIRMRNKNSCRSIYNVLSCWNVPNAIKEVI